MGGGSGGHITPIVAVINKLLNNPSPDEATPHLPSPQRGRDNGSAEVRRILACGESNKKPTASPSLSREGRCLHREGSSSAEAYDIRVWCDRKFAPQAKKLLTGTDVRVDIIAAGKLRRYANLKWWYRWFSPYHIIHTHIPNFIDMFKIAGGFIQSLCKMLVWRPDVVFCKGGYVSLPVGIVAHLYHIPLVIHDSDTVPGLTNRVLAKYANAIGTGAPVENYPSYPKKITKFIGIPVGDNVKHISETERTNLKHELGLDSNCPLVLAMGGGQGAVAINDAIASNATKLVKDKVNVVLLAGRGREVNMPRSVGKHVQVLEFTDRVTDYEQAADVVVTRAGATTMAELAAIGVATIIVPSPYLAGDHQTKNAQVYEKAGAAVVLNEFDLKDKPSILYDAIKDLLDDKSKRAKLAKNLRIFAKPDALDGMVQMILDACKDK